MTDKDDNPMMTTTEQRLVNLTARMDQMDSAINHLVKVSTIMFVSIAMVAILLLVRTRRVPSISVE